MTNAQNPNDEKGSRKSSLFRHSGFVIRHSFGDSNFVIRHSRAGRSATPVPVFSRPLPIPTQEQTPRPGRDAWDCKGVGHVANAFMGDADAGPDGFRGLVARPRADRNGRSRHHAGAESLAGAERPARLLPRAGAGVRGDADPGRDRVFVVRVQPVQSVGDDERRRAGRVRRHGAGRTETMCNCRPRS